MFTGIIEHIGNIITMQEDAGVIRLAIEVNNIPHHVHLGSSVSIDGVCLTVEKQEGAVLTFMVMPVTMEKTMLGEKQVGDSVHVEFSLTAGKEIGGHFVYGHVDGIGTVEKKEKLHTAIGDTVLLSLMVPEKWQRYLVPQGSIAINGVSLTVAQVTPTGCMVSLVPHTQEQTCLAMSTEGDNVNIEIDMLAKYVQASHA